MPFTNRYVEADQLSGIEPKMGDPSWSYEAGVKSDDTDFTGGKVTRALVCASAGTFKIRRPDDTDVTVQIAAGWNPYVCKRVWDTGSSDVDFTAVF